MTSLGRTFLLALGALLLGAAPAAAQQQAPQPAEAAPRPPPPQQGETAQQQTAPEPAASEEPEGTAEQAAAQPQGSPEAPAGAAAEPSGEVAAAGPADAAAAGQAEAPAGAAPAPDVVPGEEIATRIAETYGVEVLDVKRDDLVGGPAYAVKVMHPGGNSNAAFQVSTLLVDAVTGELIPQFRHRPIGYQLSGAMRAEPATPQDGTALRRRTHLPAPRQAGGDAEPGG